MRRRAWSILITSSLGILLLLGVAVLSGRTPASGTGHQQGTVSIYTDTFATLSGWQVTERNNTGYQWGLAPYSQTVGSAVIADQGLWAAAGGALGEAQTWFTGSYTPGMMTVAVVGPFELGQPTAEVRLSARVQNRIADGDQLHIALSTDGLNPLPEHDIPVPGDPDVWQVVTRSAGPFGTGQQVWIFLRFVAISGDVDRGPLVDDIVLEAVYSHDVYVPLIRLDPTPTPTPILTYEDHFADPNSGWRTGWVQRYNIYERGGILYQRWEDVAHLGYVPGHYRITVPMDWRGGSNVFTWFVWPAEIAPLPAAAVPLPDSYCVEARARFANSWDEEQPYMARWGVVFGANATQSGDDLTEIYTFQINANHKLGMLRYHNYIYPGDRQPIDGREENVEIALYRWPNTPNPAWSPTYFGNPSTSDYNTLKVWVHGTKADFYVNGARITSADIGDMPRIGVGVTGGSNEITPVEVDFDYFRYDPTCTGP